MRRILFGDLVVAASVLAANPAGARPGLADHLLTQADGAHRYAKHFRRPHPFWGDGSLLTRALLMPHRAAPDLSDPQFLAVLAQMTRAAARYKSANRGLDLVG